MTTTTALFSMSNCSWRCNTVEWMTDKGIWPVNNWVLVCWQWWLYWS